MGVGKKVIMLCIAGIIGISVLVAMWPEIQTQTAAVAALTQTDIGTTILQVVAPFWPLMIGVAAVMALIGAAIIKKRRG